MKLKSLLLGSAAVLVAASVAGARAADAIVVEPEPVEYVRICDAYGEGWFYIPGHRNLPEVRRRRPRAIWVHPLSHGSQRMRLRSTNSITAPV